MGRVGDRVIDTGSASVPAIANLGEPLISITRLLFFATIDKATVPTFYESRITQRSLNEAELP